MNAKCPYMRKAEGGKTQTEEKAMQNAEAEVGIMQPCARQYEGQLGDTRHWQRPGGFLLQNLWRKHSPADTLIWDFWPPEP